MLRNVSDEFDLFGYLLADQFVHYQNIEDYIILTTISQLGFIITNLAMYRIIFTCLMVVLGAASYSSTMGVNLCRLSVASYCKKVDV